MNLSVDRVSLERVVRENLNLVYASALRQVSDSHVAADVTQAVFLLLQRNFARLEGHPAVTAWLLRVTRYACLDAKKLARRRAYHERRAASMRTEATDDTDDAELPKIIDEALDRLSESDRTVVAMAYFQGLSHQHVGERLGISQQAANKRIQRAIAKLRSVLTQHKSAASVTGMAAALRVIGEPSAAPAAVLPNVMNCIDGQVPARVQTIARGTHMKIKFLSMRAGGLLTLVSVGALMLGMAAHQFVFAQTDTNSAAVVPPAADNSFLPEKTLTLQDGRTGRANILADLNAGNAITSTLVPTPDWTPLTPVIWGAEQGADVTVTHDRSGLRLLGLDMAVAPWPEAQFDKPVPLQMVTSLLRVTPASMEPLAREGAVPETFVFRTREGGVGLLQIQQMRQHSVDIRFKLLNPDVRNKACVDAVVKSGLLPEIDRSVTLIAASLDTNQADAPTLARSLARSTTAVAETLNETLYQYNAYRSAAAARNLVDAILHRTDADAKASLAALTQAAAATFADIQKAASANPTSAASQPNH